MYTYTYPYTYLDRQYAMFHLNQYQFNFNTIKNFLLCHYCLCVYTIQFSRCFVVDLFVHHVGASKQLCRLHNRSRTRQKTDRQSNEFSLLTIDYVFFFTNISYLLVLSTCLISYIIRQLCINNYQVSYYCIIDICEGYFLQNLEFRGILSR